MHQAPIPRVPGIVSLHVPLAAEAVVGTEPQGAPLRVVGAEQWLVPQGRGNGSGGAARGSSDVFGRKWDWVGFIDSCRLGQCSFNAAC